MGLRADICICLIKNKIVVVVERVEKLDGEENAHEQRKWGGKFFRGDGGKNVECVERDGRGWESVKKWNDRGVEREKM